MKKQASVDPVVELVYFVAIQVWGIGIGIEPLVGALKERQCQSYALRILLLLQLLLLIRLQLEAALQGSFQELEEPHSCFPKETFSCLLHTCIPTYCPLHLLFSHYFISIFTFIFMS